MLIVWLLVLGRILHLVRAVVSVVVVMAMRRFPSVFSKTRRDGHRQTVDVNVKSHSRKSMAGARHVANEK